MSGRIAAACLLGSVIAAPADAQTGVTGRVELTVEGATAWQWRNDVRTPNDTGTEFSIVDLIGAAPTPSIRVTGVVDVTERHRLRVVYAPLRLTGRGIPAAPIDFAGVTFDSEETDAVYKFNSYRATWSYRLHEGETWTWRVGFTGFVRDARVALVQDDSAAEDVDVGFVPLGHVSATARLSPRWSAVFVLDAAAARQGRAIDFAGTLDYRPSAGWRVFGGYRTIEGGADVDSVYAFAWLNAVVAGVGFRF
jgi:hypothetical protein